ACQAPSLGLRRRAGARRRPDALAAWLHGVPSRVAPRPRARRDPPAPTVPAADAGASPPEQAAWREVCRVLDEELAALPARLRAPLVLCHLDGRTRDEAARRLGWSLATLKRRLARGRRPLRQRVLRPRGAAAALAAAALSPRGLRPAVPEALSAAALASAAGGGAEVVVALAAAAARPLGLGKLLAGAALGLTLVMAAGAAVWIPGREVPATP